LGKGASNIHDGTQPDVHDEDNEEGILVLGHLCMSLVWPRENIDLPTEFGHYARLVGK